MAQTRMEAGAPGEDAAAAHYAPPRAGETTGWRRLLAILIVVSVIEAGAYSHILRFMPLYLRTVGVSSAAVPTTTGLLAAVPFLLGLPLIPFWGVWADRYGQRLVIARSAFVEAVVFGGLGLSRSLWQVGLCLLLVGFQLGNTGIMLSTLRGAAPERRLGMVIAIFGVGPPLGIALGPVLGGLAVDHGLVTLHGMFGADGVLSFLAGLLLMLGVREMRPATRVAGRAVALAWDAVHAAFTTPTSVLLFVIFGLAYLAQQTAGPFFPLLVAHLHGTGSGLATAIGAVFGGSAVAGVLLSPAAGVIGDRVGFRPVLIGATLLGAASLALMSAAANLLELALLGVLLGAAGAAVTSMVFALLATLVPEERRTATLNLVYVPLYFAGLTGGTLGAFLVRRGLTSVLVASSLIMMAAGMVSLTRLRRREAR